jgi:hypothetical protein
LVVMWQSRKFQRMTFPMQVANNIINPSTSLLFLWERLWYEMLLCIKSNWMAWCKVFRSCRLKMMTVSWDRKCRVKGWMKVRGWEFGFGKKSDHWCGVHRWSNDH